MKLGFPVSGPQNLAIRLLALRCEAPKLPVGLFDIETAASTALPHEPGVLADYTPSVQISSIFAYPPFSNGLDDLVVDAIEGDEPVLVGDDVCLVRELISVVQDRLTAVTALPVPRSIP